MILQLKKERKITSIVVTHDIDGAKSFSDRLILMNEGKILVEGTFDDLKKSRNKFVVQFLNGGS